MNPPTDDAEASILADLAQRRKTRIAFVVALVVTGIYLVRLLVVSDALRGASPLLDAYYWGYALAPVSLSALIALGAAAFRGRTWLRSLIAYSVGMVFGFIGSMGLLDRIEVAKDDETVGGDSLGIRRRMEGMHARLAAVKVESEQVEQALATRPPLGPASLASPERTAEALRLIEKRSDLVNERMALIDSIDEETAKTRPELVSTAVRSRGHEVTKAKLALNGRISAILQLLTGSREEWSVENDQLVFRSETVKEQVAQHLEVLRHLETEVAAASQALDAEVDRANGR